MKFRGIIASLLLLLSISGCEREIHFAGREGCSIEQIRIEVGECTGPDTYKLFILFDKLPPSDGTVDVFVRNNVFVGNFSLTSPLVITQFKRSGLEYDFVKVVLKNKPQCFAVAEFKPPVCESTTKCSVSGLTVQPGECNADGTYKLKLSFKPAAAGNDYFNVFIRDNKLIGTYKVADLPVTIPSFKPSGKDFDFIKVAINDRTDCFAVAEFKPPHCNEQPCALADLLIDPVQCVSTTAYTLKINFKYNNPGNDYFDVFIRDNKRIGTYKFSDLPLTIREFPKSGKDYDFIKIAVNDRNDCFIVKEFISPKCQ